MEDKTGYTAEMVSKQLNEICEGGLGWGHDYNYRTSCFTTRNEKTRSLRSGFMFGQLGSLGF